MLENTDTQLAYLDPDFNFISVNESYVRGCGLSYEQLIGHNHFDLFPDEENRKLFAGVRDTGQKIEFYAKPFKNPQLPEQGITYWDWTLTPVKDDLGKVQGLVLSLKDVTHRHRIKKISGQSAYRLLLLTVGAVFLAEFTIMAIFSLISESESFGHAFLDASLLVVLVFPLLYFLLIRPLIYNISERKAAQEALAESYAKLEQTVLNRTEELARANEKLLAEINIRHHAEMEMKCALENSRQREAEISALLAGAREVLDQREFRSTVKTIFESCKQLIKATGGYLNISTSAGNESELIFLDCTDDDSLPDRAILDPVIILGENLYQEGRPCFLNDLQGFAELKNKNDSDFNIDNVLIVPLMIDQRVNGLLGLFNKSGGFDENDCRMATAFGELAAIALFNSRTREELKKSEARYRAVVQTASDAIININHEGEITFWNEAASQIFGYASDELIGKQISIILPEEMRARHEKGIKRFLQTGQSRIIGSTVEMTAIRKNGEEFPIGLSLSSWKTGDELRFTSIIRDISERKTLENELLRSKVELEERVRERTAELSDINELLNTEIEERKKAEESLEKERQRLFSVLDEIPASIHLVDREYKIRFANRYFRTQFGSDRELPCFKVKKGQKAPCDDCVTFKVFESGEPNIHEGRYVDNRLYRIFNYPFRDIDGAELILQLGIDITEQKQAEDDLRESEERFRVLVNSMNDTVFTLNRDQIVQEIYGGSVEPIGMSADNLIGRNIEQIFDKDLVIIHRKAADAVLKGKNTVYEWAIEAPDGLHHMQNSMAPIYDSDGRIDGLVGIARDITMQKKLEAQLIQTEKLMAVGQMSAMIAHEFRNALTSLRMILELQLESDTITESENRSLQVALGSVTHMENIVSQLVGFARPAPLAFSKTDITKVIAESVQLIKPYCIKNRVDLEEELGENMAVINADPLRLKESFVNLLLNAVQSLKNTGNGDHKGKVKISARNFIAPADLINEPDAGPDPGKGGNTGTPVIKKGLNCIGINVTDNGPGIPAKDLKHIFDPFFTTKIGGTGLGMHMVRRTVIAHHGIIRIKSNPQQGTNVEIFLPVNE